MQNKDAHRFNVGLNKDDHPTELQPGEYTDALNMRVASSTGQQGVGIFESLQGEVELLINVSAVYYGGAIGGQFVYEGYEEVSIGNQVWMAKNWDKYYAGSRVYGDDPDTNQETYGRLYTWNMIHEADFCPPGWRVPTEADFIELFAYLGSQAIAGGKMKEAGSVHWIAPNTDADNVSGFTGLPGGKYANSIYQLLSEVGMFWILDDIDPGLDLDMSITTTRSGMFSITLTGDGFVAIDWGDGVVEVYHLDETPIIITHSFAAGGTISVYNGTGIKSIKADGQLITNLSISESCVNLESINFSNNSIAAFTTHLEWINLSEIDFSNNLLASFILYEWLFSSLTEACILNVSHNNIGSLSIPASWNTNGGIFNASYNNLTTINVSNLDRFMEIDVSHNNMVSITLPVGDVLWKTIRANDNDLTVFSFSPTSAALLETIEIQNNDIITFVLADVVPMLMYLDASDNEITTFTSYAGWGLMREGMRYFNFEDNAIGLTPINSILSNFDSIVGLHAWTEGDYLNVALGTSAGPQGSGLVAKVSLLAKLATIITNVATDLITLPNLFSYLWIGDISGSQLISEIDGRKITVVGKDFSDNYLPETTAAVFNLQADSDFIIDDTADELWFQAGIQRDVVIAELIGEDHSRTLVKYTNSSPHETYAIGLLRSDVVLTPDIVEILASDFWLWILWGWDL